MQKTLALKEKLEIALYVTHLSISTFIPVKNTAVHSALITFSGLQGGVGYTE